MIIITVVTFRRDFEGPENLGKLGVFQTEVLGRAFGVPFRNSLIFWAVRSGPRVKRLWFLNCFVYLGRAFGVPFRDVVIFTEISQGLWDLLGARRNSTADVGIAFGVPFRNWLTLGTWIGLDNKFPWMFFYFNSISIPPNFEYPMVALFGPIRKLYALDFRCCVRKNLSRAVSRKRVG